MDALSIILGIIILATAAVFYHLYDKKLCDWMDERRKGLSRTERREQEAAWVDTRKHVLVQYVIWTICAVAAFLGDILGIGLAVLGAIDAIASIFVWDVGADTTESWAYFWLMTPFALFIALGVTKIWQHSLAALIIGIAIAVVVWLAVIIVARNTRGKEE